MPRLPPSVVRGSGGCNAMVQAEKDTKMNLEVQLLSDLSKPELRGNALAELSKKREMFSDLALLMWHSFGSIIILLQEILEVYPALSPPTLTACASSRVCNAIALLQSVASHPETRASFLKAYIPIYLYPLLNTVSNAKSFEYMRLTSLGVIGALVKPDDTEAISFLLQSEFIPLCLRIMEIGEELSKTVATYIVERIMVQEAGLQYMCATPDRFFAVTSVLQNMLIPLAEQPSARLLKHIIRCYLKLTAHPRALMELQIRFPEVLRNGTFDHCLEADPVAKNCLRQLLDILAARGVGAPESGGSTAVGAPRAAPVSSQAGPSQHNAGPGSSSQAWPSLRNAGPGSSQAWPSLRNAGPGPSQVWPSQRNAGPGPFQAWPSQRNAGPGPFQAWPSQRNAGPGPSQAAAGPGSSQAGPSRRRGRR